MKSYLKQENVAPSTPPHNFILFELDFDVKFPLLCLLLFLSNLKSTILCCCICECLYKVETAAMSLDDEVMWVFKWKKEEGRIIVSPLLYNLDLKRFYNRETIAS